MLEVFRHVFASHLSPTLLSAEDDAQGALLKDVHLELLYGHRLLPTFVRAFECRFLEERLCELVLNTFLASRVAFGFFTVSACQMALRVASPADDTVVAVEAAVGPRQGRR